MSDATRESTLGPEQTNVRIWNGLNTVDVEFGPSPGAESTASTNERLHIYIHLKFKTMAGGILPVTISPGVYYNNESLSSCKAYLGQTLLRRRCPTISNQKRFVCICSCNLHNGPNGHTNKAIAWNNFSRYHGNPFFSSLPNGSPWN